MFLAEAPNEDVKGLIQARMWQQQAATAQGKPVMRKDRQREGGAVQKGAKGLKQCKKAVQHRRAKQSPAGKAGTKETASMLKMAKYAGLAPSAAAKLPQLKAGAPSSHQAPSMSVKGSKFPARPRGQPKGSAKAFIKGSTPTGLQERHTSVTNAQQHRQQHLQLSLPQPHQQQHMSLADQPSVSAGAAEAQRLSSKKRKWSAPDRAVSEDTLQEAEEVVHRRKRAHVDMPWMSGGGHSRDDMHQQQSVVPNTDFHLHEHAQHLQHAGAQQTQAAQPATQTVLTKQGQPFQPSQQADHSTHFPGAGRSTQGSAAGALFTGIVL